MDQQSPPAHTGNGDGSAPETNTFDARVATICAQVSALDHEIATLEQTVAPLPDVLAALEHHPVLWLLIGREGIDRPGTLGAIVGQQVVTVVRRDRTTLLLTGLAMFLLGASIGVGGIVLLQGGLLR